MRVGERTIELTHPDRVLFPDDGITKADLAAYYAAVAEWMVPHVAGRPVNLQRFPEGIAHPGFFQQEMPEYFPDWIASVVVSKAGGELRHVVIEDAATLVYLANQACITPHAWLSRVDDLEHPDQMIFDLDPAGTDDPLVRPAALRLGALLHELGLPAFVKTSGSRGYHVVVPLDRSADYDTVRTFAQDTAALLARVHGAHLTTEVRKRQRRGRILIDTLRNAYAHTAVPPYAVRARRGAPVALPLAWEELEDPAMHPQRFPLREVPGLLARREDPWRAMATTRAALRPARARLDALLAEHGPARERIPRRIGPAGPDPSGTAGAKPSVRSPALTRQRQAFPGPPR
ncbi:MAG TPA: non-homologous end-joining DNA ligase [Gemmatimonadales bacterium]|nr:non-homologous end-joining DNA ligase [Gemmatimonadales bacterium]